MEELTASLPDETGAAETAECETAEAPAAEGEELTGKQSAESEAESIDYAALAREDIRLIKGAIEGLDSLDSISQLKDPLRYGALRDLGLSATEAFLATGGMKAAYDNRSHLTSSIPAGAAGAAADMPRQDYEMMRELFSDMSDAQLKKLYRKVTK